MTDLTRLDYAHEYHSPMPQLMETERYFEHPEFQPMYGHADYDLYRYQT